jgi:hypothetical protein
MRHEPRIGASRAGKAYFKVEEPLHCLFNHLLNTNCIWLVLPAMVSSALKAKFYEISLHVLFLCKR